MLQGNTRHWRTLHDEFPAHTYQATCSMLIVITKYFHLFPKLEIPQIVSFP